MKWRALPKHFPAWQTVYGYYRLWVRLGVWEQRQVEVEISQRAEDAKGFQVEPQRWIVERTWIWLENARILNRDYERLPENHEGMIYIVMIRLMLRRLTKNKRTWDRKTA